LRNSERPFLILVTGLPGTGKTQLARAVACHFGLPVLAKDAIKEPLFEVFGTGDRGHSRRLSDASFAVMFAVARELLRAGTSLILEGNFRPGEHEAPLAGPPIAQVACCVDESVRMARLQARAGDPTRHAGHNVGQYSVAPGGFLDIPGPRFEFDSSETPPRYAPLLARLERELRSNIAAPPPV
jgi:predicted kinase